MPKHFSLPPFFCFFYLYYYFLIRDRFEQLLNFRLLINPCYDYKYINNYRVHNSIPNNFTSFEIDFVNKWLPNYTKRYERHLIYQPNKKVMVANRIKLHETIYGFVYNTTHLNLKDAFVNGYCAFGRGEDILIIKGQDSPQYKLPVRIVGYVDTAISFTRFKIVISSLFYNILFPMYGIPEDIIQKASIILPNDPHKPYYVTHFFELFFPNMNVIFLSQHEYYQVHDYHTVINPTPGIQHYSYGILYIVEKIKQKLNLYNLKPSKYGYSNRAKGLMRYIDNFDELTSEVRKNYGEYSWEFIPDRYEEYQTSFKLWYQLKFIMVFVGSNIIPVMMLQPGSGVYYISGNRFDWECVAVATSCYLWSYYVPLNNVNHYSFQPISVDIPTIIDTVGDLLYAVQHQKWPQKALDVNKGFVRHFALNPR